MSAEALLEKDKVDVSQWKALGHILEKGKWYNYGKYEEPESDKDGNLIVGSSGPSASSHVISTRPNIRIAPGSSGIIPQQTVSSAPRGPERTSWYRKLFRCLSIQIPPRKNR